MMSHFVRARSDAIDWLESRNLIYSTRYMIHTIRAQAWNRLVVISYGDCLIDPPHPLSVTLSLLSPGTCHLFQPVQILRGRTLQISIFYNLPAKSR